MFSALVALFLLPALADEVRLFAGLTNAIFFSFQERQLYNELHNERNNICNQETPIHSHVPFEQLREGPHAAASQLPFCLQFPGPAFPGISLPLTSVSGLRLSVSTGLFAILSMTNHCHVEVRGCMADCELLTPDTELHWQ